MTAPAEMFLPGNPAHASFRTGLIPTPPLKLAQAIQSGRLKVFEPKGASPPSFAMIPKQRSMFLNDRDGDCVTAEEAFDVSAVSAYCSGTEYLPTDQTVLAFCNKYNVLNGAELLEVIQAMERDGLHQGGDTITDGTSAVVDYRNLAAVQNAISNGGGNSPNCLKLGIMSSALPSGAGNKDGYYQFGPGPRGPEDHSTCLCGYGTAKFCFDTLGVNVPSGVDPNKADCLLHYTWSTIGVVDLQWLVAAASEAYIRSSVMLNGKAWTKVPGPNVCPAGQHWDAVQNMCVPDVGPFNWITFIMDVLKTLADLGKQPFDLALVLADIQKVLADLTVALKVVQEVLGPAAFLSISQEQHDALRREAALAGLPATINWLGLVRDLVKLFGDFQNFNVTVIIADVQAIIKDLGF